MQRQGYLGGAEHPHPLSVKTRDVTRQRGSGGCTYANRSCCGSAVLEALQRWAEDELLSVNGQIDYLLQRALRQAGQFRSGQRTLRTPLVPPVNTESQ